GNPRPDHGAQRRPADLVVQRDEAEDGDRAHPHRLRQEAALPPPAPGRLRGRRPDRPAALPGAARRAVPGLSAVGQGCGCCHHSSYEPPPLTETTSAYMAREVSVRNVRTSDEPFVVDCATRTGLMSTPPPAGVPE